MPEFMDVHDAMHGITPEALHEAHEADLAIQAEESVDFKRAWADPVSGNVLPVRGAERRRREADP